MTPEHLLSIANEAVYRQTGRHLSDVEVAIFQGAIADQTYEQISEASGYSISYVKRDAGPKFWKRLGVALAEPVSKTNFRAALQRWEEQHLLTLPTAAPTPAPAVVDSAIETDLPPVYIQRPPVEETCFAIVQEPGALLRIKAPHLMGKTSLINHLLAQVADLDYRIVYLNLGLADSQTHFSDINRFMRWFCCLLSRELGLPSQLDEYWNEVELGVKISCTAYLEEYLLPQAETPLLLCLDNVDVLFPYPAIYEDFFGLLRSWHEKGKHRPLWKQLRLLLAHATDVYIRLNINQSPFNVGVPIELAEFTPEQVQALVQQHNLTIAPAAIAQLMEIVGGHPYLLQQTFASLKRHPDLTLSAVLAAAVTPSSIYSHHLRDRWLNLQAQPELLAAFKSVVLNSQPVSLEPILAYQLHRMGLVKFCGNRAVPCCRLYQQYFGSQSESVAAIAPSLAFLEGPSNGAEIPARPA